MDIQFVKMKNIKFDVVLVFFLNNFPPSVSTYFCPGIDGNSCCLGYKMHPVKKICVPCEMGYTGVNCDDKCPFPTYGNGCQMICACEEEYCDFVNGCNRFPLEVSSKSHNYKDVSIIKERFSRNFISTDGGFNTTLGINGDNANYKKDNTPLTKLNKSDSLLHAIIGLAIVAFLIVIVYLYTYQQEKCQLPCSNV